MLVLLTCALLHALLIGDGTCLSGPNVCFWIASQEDYMYCCFGFEQIGNQCKACKIGFTTTKLLGSPCQQCTSYTFGNNCSSICSCSATERCDHVNEEENKTLNGYRSQVDTCSSTKLVNYCLTIVCILLAVVMCFFVIKHKHDVREKQQTKITDPEHIQVNSRSNENNAVDDGINTYHVIDESQMEKSRDEPNSGNAYLNVFFSESDSVDEENSNTCNDGYLQPYHLTRELLTREFETESNHNNCTEDGYLLSNNDLIERRQSLKHITQTAIINTEVGESISSASSVTHTDLERYMQMHGQLQNLIKSILHQYNISPDKTLAAARSTFFNIEMNSESKLAEVEALNESVC